MPINSVKAWSEFPMDYIDFSAAAVAASQTDQALLVNANDATSGTLNIVGVPALFAGYIVGLSISMTANKTAGTMTFTPTVNTTKITAPSGLVAVAIANTTKSNAVTAFAYDGTQFAQGALLGVKYTTNGSFAPTTNDLLVRLYVVYDRLQV